MLVDHPLFNDVPNKYQELTSLAIKVQVMQEMIAWNSTLEMGPKYQNWLDRQTEMIGELLLMLEEDVREIEDRSYFEEMECI